MGGGVGAGLRESDGVIVYEEVGCVIVLVLFRWWVLCSLGCNNSCSPNMRSLIRPKIR